MAANADRPGFLQVDQVALAPAVTLAELALEELFGQAGSAEPECKGQRQHHATERDTESDHDLNQRPKAALKLN
jgi:hypothetical protein